MKARILLISISVGESRSVDVEGKDMLMGGFLQILPLVSSLPH